MTRKWKATMPKEPPKAGFSQIVMATLNDEGDRLEFTGQVPYSEVEFIMEKVVRASKMTLPRKQVACTECGAPHAPGENTLGPN